MIQEDWDNPDVEAWGDRMAKFASGATQPVVAVAHSLGVARRRLCGRQTETERRDRRVLVAPADVDYAHFWPDTGGKRWPPEKGPRGFETMPDRRLPFPAHLIVANNDLYCSYARAQHLASKWGAELSDAGESGHINIASGQGPWPEGLLQFGKFLRKLG